jgi:hypothetical protein
MFRTVGKARKQHVDPSALNCTPSPLGGEGWGEGLGCWHRSKWPPSPGASAGLSPKGRGDPSAPASKRCALRRSSR